MRRLTSNPVQELRRILKDQYSFSSIIKELIQNADDAGATRFHLGWIPDWPRKPHALLTGPAMLCLNNGEFRKADADAIWHLDEGAKGDDAGTIGKYGLGMKSVFHLCEGFFYAASADQPAADGRPFLELLNPWPEGGPHDQWSDIHEAGAAIERCLAAWPHGCERWFCLVIPLRTEAHLGGAEAILPGQFPTVDALLRSYESHELATLTTLLRFLESITVWRWDTGRKGLVVETALTLDEKPRVRRSFPDLPRGVQRSIQTRVESRASEAQLLLEASGLEALHDNPAFDQLKADKRWPKNFTLNPITGRSEDKLEKAEPHGAAIFTRRRAIEGRFRIRTAVFLPLAKGTEEDVQLDSDVHVELILHGQFFLDAGRRELYVNDGGHGSLQESWNELLLHSGVLPLICAALDDYVETWSVPDAEVVALTRALAGTQLFRDKRQHVCKSMNWISRFRRTGSRWGLEPSSAAFFELPELGPRVQPAIQLFRALPDLSDELAMVEAGRPRLTLRDVTPWPQAEVQLCRLLDSIDVSRLVDEETLSFAAEFLRPLKHSLPASAAHIVTSKLREAIVSLGARSLQSNAAAFADLIDGIPSRIWVRLGPLEKDAITVYQDLNARTLEHVLLPPELCPVDEAGGQLSIDEAGELLGWLNATRDRRPLERTSALALHVLRVTGGALPEKREQLGHHEVFLARTGDGGSSDAAMDWNSLHRIFEEGRLFAGGSAFLTALQKALSGTAAYSLYTPKGLDAFGVLFGTERAPQCNAQSCLEFLHRYPAQLAGPSERCDLLKRIVAVIDGNAAASDLAAVRYLLHGELSRRHDSRSSLLIRSSRDGGHHWGRIAQHALRRLKSEWRWIPEELWGELTANQQTMLGITHIGVRAIEGVLKEAGSDWIADLSLSNNERISLLQGIDDADVWRALPLHETIDGKHIAISGRTVFLQSSSVKQVAPRLLAIADVLAQPVSDPLLQKYRAHGIADWTNEAAIEAALATKAPSEYADEILDALEAMRSAKSPIPAQLRERLRQAHWLPLANGAAAAPVDVIVIPALDAYLRRLLAAPQVGHAFTCVADLAANVTTHSAFGVLSQRHIFPEAKESLAILAECLGSAPQYRIGVLKKIPNDVAGLRLLLGVSACLDAAYMPAAAFLRALAEGFEDRLEDVAEVVLSRLRGELPLEPLKQCVTEIARMISESPLRQQAGTRSVLRAYLHDLLKHSAFTFPVLEGVPLPSKAGTLAPAQQLCVRAESIDPAHVLIDELTDLFPSGLDAHVVDDEEVPSEVTVDPEESARVLVNYLRRWEGLVAKQLRGGLLAMFGDVESIRREADNLLSPRSVEGFRAALEWPTAAEIQALLDDLVQCWEPAVLRRLPAETFRDLELWEEAVASMLRRLKAILGTQQYESRIYGLLLKQQAQLARHPAEREFDYSDLIGASEDVHDTMRRQRFVFQVGDLASTRRVPNLIGQWFSAPIGGDVTSIFVGVLQASSPTQFSQSGDRVHVVTLRDFNPGALTLQQRKQVLFESARLLLMEVFNKRPSNLRGVWDQLEDTGQLALDIVQDQLLKNAWFYFQQLGDSKLSSLSALLRLYDELSDREIELGRSSVESAKRDLEKVRNQLARLPRQLRHEIEGNVHVQHEVLAAVRDKMSDYEYSADSVPFELFQNADDAASELADMLSGDIPALAQQINVTLQSQSLLVTHWGRPINEFCRGDYPAERGRASGYDKDLKKMLILSASDKSQRAELVTGKFGLGFKSVFLLTDRPQALSGSLAFEVLAGFFPRQLPTDELRQLADWARVHGLPRLEATVIRLPLKAETASLAAEAMHNFGELLPILLIVSKRLKTAVLTEADREHVVGHHEVTIDAERLVRRCRVSCEREISSLAHDRFIKCSGGPKGAVLLNYGADGFCPFPRHVPTYWVTAPTKTLRDVGIVVHGEFAVDVGRNQLAESSGNLEIANAIGRGFGQALVALYDASEDWYAFCDKLELPLDLERSTLWSSLWELLASSKVRGDSLLAAILCGENTGLRVLTSQRHALPTGLPAPYADLTIETAVRARLHGLLDSDGEGLAEALSWPAVTDKWEPGQLVSNRRIAASLLLDDAEAEATVPGIRLLDLLKAELGRDIDVSPETANRVGKVVTRKRLQTWSERREYAPETSEVRDFLKQLRFRTRNDGCTVAGDVIAIQAGGDEALRTAFAPDDRLLHSAYAGSGLEFFFACRAELNAPPALLADWARAADAPESRTAVLRYLLKGELDLASRLAEDGIASWIDELPDALMKSFTEQEQLKIRAQLGLGYAELRNTMRTEILRELSLAPEPEPVVEDTEFVLEQIVDWWRADGKTELGHIDRALYPTGTFFNVSSDAPETTEQRVEWLKLFLLGSLQTIGWTTPQANRNFIAECTERGWLHDVADDSSQPGRWLESLKAHIGDQESEIKYFQWMKHLVGLAIIAEHLDEYVELFLAVDRIGQHFSLDSVSSPRTSSFFQGGGPDAPPVSEVLGIGQCFIMRELVRHGVLTNAHVYPHCYVPFERTRRVVSRLGGPKLDDSGERRWDRSRRMYDFLHGVLEYRATFDLCFDLPLWLIGDKQRPDLEQRFLQ